jgi:hypothetical protein
MYTVLEWKLIITRKLLLIKVFAPSRVWTCASWDSKWKGLSMNVVILDNNKIDINNKIYITYIDTHLL